MVRGKYTRSRGVFSIAAVIALGMMPGVSNAQNVILNGGFENGTGTSFDDWMVAGDVIRNTDGPLDGAFNASFSFGDTNNDGVLSQGFATTAGGVYRLEFNYRRSGIGAPSQSLGIQVDGSGGAGSLVDEMVTASTTTYISDTYDFTADASTSTLRFSDLSTVTVNVDVLLDSVSVVLLSDPGAAQLVGAMSQGGIYRHSFMFRLLSQEIQNAVAVARGGGFGVAALPASDGIQLASYNEPGSTLQVRGQNSHLLNGGWDGFVTGYGIGGNVQSDGVAPGLNYGAGGTMAGLYRITDDGTLVGLYTGYAHQNVRLDTATATSGFVNSGDLGAFVHRNDTCCSYYTLAADVFYDSYKTSRTTATGNARGNFDGVQTGAYFERGWNRCWRGFALQPTVAMQYIWLHQNDFTETGAGANNTSVAATNTRSLRSIVGAKLTGNALAFCNGELTPEVRAHWMHEFLDERTGVSSSFGTNPAFSTNGLSLGRDWAVLATGFTYSRGGCASLYGNYELMLNDRQAFHNGTGGIQWAY